MKKSVPVLLLSGIIFFGASCKKNVLHGEGPKGEVMPAVAAFTAADVNLPVNTVVNVQAGSTPTVRLKGYNNIISHIKAKIEDGTLILYTDLDETWKLDNDNDVIAEITLPSFTGLSLSGALGAEVHGNVTGSSFKLDMSGAGNVVIDNINVSSFEAAISGAGKVTVNGGTVQHMACEINGAGKIMGYPLQAANVTSSISGVGKCEVTALQKLEATVSGAGIISYKGHPAVTQEVSGVGKITDAN